MNSRDNDRYITQYLKAAKNKIQRGDKTVLLMAIHHCLLMKKPLPKWLREAFVQAYESAYPFEARSWDEVFGPPHPKGAHLQARKRNLELRIPLWKRVQERVVAGDKIDKGLFERVGPEFGISGTTASAIYYDPNNRHLFGLMKRFNRTNSRRK